ncbi:GntR family transcriptional regulator [Herbaspirillum sp. GCM10030257]|uniref:GntR family transcriptional regulator n=1 Tax=Herbaspirillum sp. GCM10030257 TaxID=3273393 RepID=UPI00360C3583
MTDSAGTATVTRKTPFTNEEIYGRIQKAILENRLAPGTKLTEERLAEISGVSRTKIRTVLNRLAHEGLVELIPNRGAFIASPTIKQARDVFVVRRMIEPEMAKQLAATATTAQVRALRKHVRLEEEARKTNDRPAIIRLSGEFHVLVAEMVDNEILTRMMRELAPLTCLVITLYDKPSAPACSCHEHSHLVDAIQDKDSVRASELMLTHLQHIEGALNFEANDRAEIDIQDIFS